MEITQPDTTLLSGFRSAYGDKYAGQSDAEILGLIRERKGIGADISDRALAARIERNFQPDEPDSLGTRANAGIMDSVRQARQRIADESPVVPDAESTGVDGARVVEEAGKNRGILDAITAFRFAPMRMALSGLGSIVRGIDAAPPLAPMRGLPLEAQQTLERGREEIHLERLGRVLDNETPLSQSANALQSAARALPGGDYEDPNIAEETAGQLGSTVPYIAASLAGGPAATAALGIAGKAGRTIEEAQASGATPEELRKALAVAPAGAIEAIPLERALGRLVPQPLKRRAIEVTLGALEEASQEAFDAVTSNLAAKASFDPDRDILDGVQESAEAGGRIGLILNTLTTALGARGVRRPGTSPTPETTEASEQAPAGEPETAPPTAAVEPAAEAGVEQPAAESATEAAPADGPVGEAELAPEAEPDTPAPPASPAEGDSPAADAGAGGESAVVDPEIASDEEMDRAAATHAEIARIREAQGFDAEEKNIGTFVEALNEAKAPRTGPDGTVLPPLVDDAASLADRVIETDYAPTRTEGAALIAGLVKAEDTVNARVSETERLVREEAEPQRVEEAQRLQEEAIDRLELLTRANDHVGSKAGAALADRARALKRKTYEPAGVLRRATSAVGRALTTPETQALTDYANRLAASEARVVELEAQAEAAKATAAEAAVGKASRARANQSVIEAERKTAKEALRNLGFQVNSFVGIDPEALYHIGRLAKTYVQEGTANLKGRALLDETVERVKQDVPGLTDRQVWDALNASDPKARKKQVSAAKKEAKRRAREAQTQARILADIDRVVGGEPLPNRRRPITTTEVKALQKKLRDLKKSLLKEERDAEKLGRVFDRIEEAEQMLDEGYRKVKTRRMTDEPAELQEARDRLRELRNEMRAEDRLARYQDDLRTGNLAPYMKESVAQQVPEQLERARTLAYVARKRIDNRVRDMQAAEGLPGWKRVGDAVVDFYRTIKATLDISFFGRQGATLGARGAVNKTAESVQGILGDGIATKEALTSSLSAFGSEMSAQNFMRQVEEHPHYWKWKRAKLYLAELDGVRESEEVFRSTAAERIPIFGRGVRASERNMAIGLNALRINAFEKFMERHPDATVETQKAYADFVNKASGRGDPAEFGISGRLLSYLLFSPRFTVSRVQAPLALVKHWGDATVRTEIAKDLGAFYGSATAMLGLAAFAVSMFYDEDDVEIGLDPRNSDFGKLVIGQTRVDLFAGYIQPIRSVGRLMAHLGEEAGAVEGVSGARDFDVMDEFYRTFVRYKAAPALSLANTLVTGRTIVGGKQSRLETMARAHLPLIIEEAFDAYNAYDDPTASLVATAGSVAGSGIGVGVSTYDDPTKSPVVSNMLEAAEYRPGPGNADRDAFERELARLIRQQRDRLERLSPGKDGDLRYELEGLAADARYEAPEASESN